jgi:hypothetical protein
VAWCASDGGKQAKTSEQKRGLGRLLEDNLPLPYQKGTLSTHAGDHAVWQRLKNSVFVTYVRRIETEINDNGWLLGRFP